MDSNLAIFLGVVIVASIAMIVAIVNTWIRARHGIPTDEELALLAVRGGRDPDPALIEQNARLTDLVERLEERIAVLERIATDPAERTAREIESLR